MTARVDTKCRAAQTFGNDGNGGTDVDTKCDASATFGNDAVGFVRVRKRKLKGGQPSIRALPSFYGERGTSAMSFDLVRAVRVGGKPRHEFVLGLGSQKNIERDLCWFWAHAVHRMVKHGLAEDQRRRVIAERSAKARGCRRPRNVRTTRAAGRTTKQRSARSFACPRRARLHPPRPTMTSTFPNASGGGHHDPPRPPRAATGLRAEN